MTTLRLYGLTDGYGSYAQVLRGFGHAFRSYGYGPDRLVVVPLETRPDDVPLALPEADAAIFLGPHVLCSAIEQHARHRLKFVMVMPNSDRLPETSMQIVRRHATHILVPSEWAAGVVSRYADKPILVTPLGVLPEFGPVASPSLEKLYEQGEFRVLHLSSSTRERKGTLQLVKAWHFLRRTEVLRKESRLLLVVVPETRMALLEDLAERGLSVDGLGIQLENRLGGEGASPERMSHVYAGAHVVCQPSRGESFGCVPLEALACGVPIVATRATGHSQWFSTGLPGAVVVPVGPYDDIDDLPGARAPRVRSQQIARALESAYASWHDLKADALSNAAAIHAEWSYSKSLAALQSFIEDAPEGDP